MIEEEENDLQGKKQRRDPCAPPPEIPPCASIFLLLPQDPFTFKVPAAMQLKLSPTVRKRLGGIVVVLMVVYLACGSLVWWAMHQPPETFGRVMARMPGP